MALGSQPRWTVQPAAGGVQAGIDVGLREYMLRIYNYMASGLALSGIVAYVFGQYLLNNPTVARSPVMFLVILAPIGLVMWISYGIGRMQASTAQALFWVFATAMGLSLSTIFLRYTEASIVRVFFITAGTFAAMSLYGYTTRRDLTGWGSFLFMGLIGIILASLVNMVLAMFGLFSGALQFAISVIGVIVFVGLTAYDTQRLKEQYYEYQYTDGQGASKIAIMGALTLYLDFINLFIMLMQLLGVRRD